jgi:hypothetical protein
LGTYCSSTQPGAVRNADSIMVREPGPKTSGSRWSKTPPSSAVTTVGHQTWTANPRVINASATRRV